MTYNVFSGTLNPAQSVNQRLITFFVLSPSVRVIVTLMLRSDLYLVHCIFY